MKPPRLVVPGDTPISEALRLLDTEDLPGAPVVSSDRELIGVLSSDPPDGEPVTSAGAAADRSYPSVPSDQGLDFALDAMVSAGAGWLPVVDGSRVVGIVAMNEIISGYQHALRRSLRLLADITGSS